MRAHANFEQDMQHVLLLVSEHLGGPARRNQHQVSVNINPH